MREFEIRLSCVQDVQAFVAIATARSFPVYVKDHSHQVNGKSFMEMFCLNFFRPVTAAAQCSEEELEEFRFALRDFLV